MWKSEPPKEIADIIKKYTKSKLPNFFIYAKDKDPDTQVEPPNNSTMNRIAAKIPGDSKIKFNKSIGKFDYRMLMNLEYDFDISDDNDVIKAYDYWNIRQYQFNEQDDNKKDQDLYKYRQLRQKIIDDSKQDIDYIVNTLVAYLYTVRKTSAKKTLWACFGTEMVENLRANLEGKGQVCQICGKRFVPSKFRAGTVCCSQKCSQELNRRRVKEKKV